MWPAETEAMVSHKIVRRSCLGARPRYNLVVDEDVKKPTNQPTSIDSFPAVESMQMVQKHQVFLQPPKEITTTNAKKKKIIAWIPSNVSIIGNKRADRLAKAWPHLHVFAGRTSNLK